MVISRMEKCEKSHGIIGEGDADSAKAEWGGFMGRVGVPVFHCCSKCLGKINLKRRRVYFGLWFLKFQPIIGWPVAWACVLTLWHLGSRGWGWGATVVPISPSGVHPQ